ncbi:hypothetical protein [Streptomyces paromomycinus]|uniref:Uncharacterized protein n=1 Tax=Streptomyces paromomycinus TaxID=92743 RepID=A0A401W4C9_STREY|nr:hypothetical protein [Streptomyces paromomycinus]GCD44151.1 hypothetical protein GKJPGBOP_03842 [Streptomyces paromomycinus]
MAWDHYRNEPVSEENTTEELTGLTAAARAAEQAGDTGWANVLHNEINDELDVLEELRGNR